MPENLQANADKARRALIVRCCLYTLGTVGKRWALKESFEHHNTDRRINVDNSKKIFEEWTGTSNTNDSPIKTHSSNSKIIVECDDKEQHAKQFIYHIYRYGKYLTSFKEDSSCFEYETHGNEGVYKFLVEIIGRDEKKSLLGFSIIHIFSEATKSEYQKYLDTKIYDNEKAVNFFPLKYPFQDFLITLNVNKGKPASMENGFVIDMPAENVTVVSKTGLSDISNGKLILSGHFNEGERYIYGQEDVSSEDKLSDYMDKVGGYAFVGVNERGVICSTDYFGLCTLYCYRKDNRAYISNRYQFLLRVLKACGEDLAISEKFIKRTMHTLNNYFSDYPVGDALVEGIETIPLGKQIRISNGVLILENSEIAEVFDAPKIDPGEEYKKLLYMARDEIISNARNLLESKHFDSFSMDLTGGIDSRLTFAGVSRVKGSNKKVSIYSGFAKDNPEFMIACSLADAFGFDYDFRRSWFKNNRVGNYNESYREQIDLAASLSMNKLLDPAVFPRRRSMMLERAMTIDGTAVEICTRNYALKFFTPERLNSSYSSPDNQHLSYSVEKVLSQANITTESMLDTVNEQIQRLPGDSDMEKLDCYLLFYRSRNHFSMQRDGGYNQSRFACGLSKNAFKAYRLTYGRIGAYQMVFDLMYLINPVVAGYQYGEPKYDELKKISCEKSLVADNYSFIPYKSDISRFEQQQKEYIDAINNKQEFNDSVTTHFNSVNSNILDKDVYLNNISYEDLHFVLNYCSRELRESIGIDLFYFISEYLPSLEDKYPFSQKSKTFFIKIHDIASQIREII